MITAPKEPLGYFASAWLAGVALVMLIVGLHGATQPLLPPADSQPAKLDPGNDVLLEQFNPPSVAAAEKPPEPQSVEEPDVEIPLLPVIMAPLTPPEMVELTPLEEPPPSAPKPNRMPPKPKEERESKRTVAPSNAGAGGGEITTFTGGSGRFPSPPYPAAARASKLQGTVRLLVTVESTGLPSSVTIQSSSGSAALDSAARDHISRRWRWPAGEVRRYIVPVRFILQP